MLTVDSWLEESQLPESLLFEEIASKGIPQKSLVADLKFQVGHQTSIDLNVHSNSASSKLRLKYMLCKVAIGKAFNCTEEAIGNGARIPDGYDSFVIDDNKLKEGESILCFENWIRTEQKINNLRYVVKEHSQVLPLYIVSFELDLELEKAMRECLKCDNCEISPASLRCDTDRVNLCVACDAALHSGKVGNRHSRHSLDKSAKMSSACKQHPDKLIEFYCPTCNIPVCVHCKMTGHHASGESSRHKLVGIMEAYHSIFEASKTSDPLFDARYREISDQINFIIEKAKSIERNQSSVEAELEDRFKRAIAELRLCVCKKYNLLKGELAELYRRSLEMSNMDEFLNYQKSGGAVLQFILDWSHYLKLKSEIHASPFVKVLQNPVEPDIRIQGTISISSGTRLFTGDEEYGAPGGFSALQSPTAAAHAIEFEKYRTSSQDTDKFLNLVNNDHTSRKYEESFNETLRNLKNMNTKPVKPLSGLVTANGPLNPSGSPVSSASYADSH